MALAIDASSPALVTTFTDPLTTASFSPPDASLLVALCFIEDLTDPPIVITNTGTALTWTQRVIRTTTEIGSGVNYGGVAIYTAPNTAAQTGITVTLSLTGVDSTAALKVYVITGADLSSPVGATGEGNHTTNNSTPTIYTSTVDHSRAICAAQEWLALGTPTSTDTEEAFGIGSLAGMAVTKSANTTPSGSTVTIGMDAAGSSAARWIWVAVEIKPTTAIPATATPSALGVTVTAPAPALSTGRTLTPAALAAVVDMPAPSTSGGATASPGTVAAVASVPAALVQSGGNVTVAVDEVAVPVAVPTPSFSVTVVVPGVQTLAIAAAIPAPTIVLPLHATVTPEVLAVAVALLPPEVQTPALPGALITADGQIEYGDPSSPILLGAGTYYRVAKISGWDAVSADNGNTRRGQRHGHRSGPKLAGQRIVTVEVTVESFSDPALVADRYAELELATPILEDADEVPLVIRLYDGQTRLAYGALIDRDMPDDGDYSAGAGKLRLQFACSDVLRYHPDASSAVILPGGSMSAVNAGNTAARPAIRISGACTSPALVNATTGQTLAFGLILASDEWIDVDCNLGTARFGGEVSVLKGLSPTSVPTPEAWWLQPGSNEVSFTCTSPGPGARADLTYRSSYL